MNVDLLTGTGSNVPGELVVMGNSKTAYFNPTDKSNPNRLVIAEANVSISEGERGATGVCVGVDVEGFVAVPDTNPTKYEKRRLMFNHIC